MVNRSVVQKVGIGALAVLASVTLAACGSSQPKSAGRPVRPTSAHVVAPPLSSVHTFVVQPASVGQSVRIALPANAQYDPAVLDAKHPGITKQGWGVATPRTYFDVAVYVAPNTKAAAALAKEFVGTPPQMETAPAVSGHLAWLWKNTAKAAKADLPFLVATGHAYNLVVLDGRVVYSVWGVGPSASADMSFVHSFSIVGS